MKKPLQTLICVAALAATSACVVAPVPRAYGGGGGGGIVYVAPLYASPGPGWGWEHHPREGWGWYHRDHGWHRGWR